MTPDTNLGGAVVFGIGTALFLLLAVACAYETFALATGNVTITAVTRGAIGHHHLVAFAITAAALIVIGHFWR